MARRTRNRRGQFSGHRRTRKAAARRRRRSVIRYSAPRARRRGTRRRYRRNPPISSGVKGLVPPLKSLAAGVVGATGTRFLTRQAEKFFPAVMASTPARVAAGFVSAIAAGFIASKVMGRQFGNDVAQGGLIVMADELTRAYVLPAVGLSAYIEGDSYIPQLSGQVDDEPDALPGADSMGDYMDDDFAPMGDVGTVSRLDVSNRL